MSQSATSKNYTTWTDVLTERKLRELLSLWVARLEESKTQDYRDHCEKQIRLYKIRLARLGLTP